ncbi:hypothetical protein [Streptomyces litmocidini]|uniref:Uncharacterized protein n=1 Tax=Streptomyces litmocidini TaxID=67318 RepID=A0ABW7U7U6_9ACTN
MVFENVTRRSYDIDVQLRCDGAKVRYLDGAQRVDRLRNTVRVSAPPYKTTSIMVPLAVSLSAINEGTDESLVIEEIVIWPRDGYGRYLPEYYSTAETSINVDCKYP